MSGAVDKRDEGTKRGKGRGGEVLLAHDCNGLVASVLLCVCEVVHEAEQDRGIDTPPFWPLSNVVQCYGKGGGVLGGERREKRGGKRSDRR